MDAKALDALRHLNEIDMVDVIKDIGLYTPLLIDTYSSNKKYDYLKKSVSVSDDVKKLYALIFMKEPLYLPCAECKKELAFNQIYNTDIYKKPWALAPADVQRLNVAGSSSEPQNYSLYSNTLLVSSNIPKDKTLETASMVCKNSLLDYLPFFLVELSCSLIPEHTIRCFFSLTPFSIDERTEAICREYTIKELKAKLHESEIPEATAEEKEALRLSHIAEHTLILKKVGQTPSLADMQFFDLQRYQKLLKNHYRELTKAIGLHSAGVGIGAFVYLRRIFEALCDTLHKECTELSGWDENKYMKMRFNEKMEYLSQFGKQVIPEELNSIKLKLYGVMSKGVHEYSESDCQELFPYVRTAIELILDQRLACLEKQKKVDELAKVISSAKV